MAMRSDPTDRALLAFESQWWRFAGAKESAIRERFGLSGVQYYKRLNAILDGPDPQLAVEYGPVLARLVRQRDARSARRRARVA